MSEDNPFNRTSFHVELSREFEKHGYVWNSQLNQFRKSSSSGFSNIIVNTANYDEQLFIDVHFGVRFEAVERTTMLFLNMPLDYQANSNTLITGINSFQKEKKTRVAQNHEELSGLSREVLEFFESDGYEFLERMSILENAEADINRHPNLPSNLCPNPIYRCFRGVVMARLANNPRWNDIHKAYLHYLESSKASHHLIESYMKLIGYLNAFGLN